MWEKCISAQLGRGPWSPAGKLMPSSGGNEDSLKVWYTGSCDQYWDLGKSPGKKWGWIGGRKKEIPMIISPWKAEHLRTSWHFRRNLSSLPQLGYQDPALPVTPASSCATLTTLWQYWLSSWSTNTPSFFYLKALACLQEGHHQSFPPERTSHSPLEW